MKSSEMVQSTREAHEQHARAEQAIEKSVEMSKLVGILIRWSGFTPIGPPPVASQNARRGYPWHTRSW
jgi:hypothetical protein